MVSCLGCLSRIFETLRDDNLCTIISILVLVTMTHFQGYRREIRRKIITSYFPVLNVSRLIACSC